MSAMCVPAVRRGFPREHAAHMHVRTSHHLYAITQQIIRTASIAYNYLRTCQAMLHIFNLDILAMLLTL